MIFGHRKWTETISQRLDALEKRLAELEQRVELTRDAMPKWKAEMELAYEKVEGAIARLRQRVYRAEGTKVADEAAPEPAAGDVNALIRAGKFSLARRA